jgi:alpha-tubulin suppressor-like RCC1 family protein
MRRIAVSVMSLLAVGVLVQCSEDGTGPGEPAIALSNASVAVTGFAGGENPAPVRIDVTNGGTGSLSDLSTAIAYGSGQPSGWLTASLSADTAPSVLTLTAATSGLPKGQFTATVSVGSAAAANTPQVLDVALVVADPLEPWAGLHARIGGTCGLMTVGAAFCWGANESGQIGDGRTGRATAPTAVVGGMTFTQLAAGNGHTCGLTPAGAAYCWGLNVVGQLGDGSTTNRFTPTEVAGGVIFASLTAGDAHTCGLTAGGDAYCWGGNADGQLGDGSTGNRLQPTAVAGDVTFALLTGGAVHTCGVTATGEGYCWGNNEYGQLGDGTTARRLQPTPVTGGLTFAGLSAGNQHTCGRDTDDAAHCWGRNDRGQLGDGTSAATRLVPTPVSGGLTFSAVVTGSGSAHTCGVAASGAPYCWGANGDGQIGDGTVADRLSPTTVEGGLVLGRLSVGGGHSCGVTSAGGVAYCWGANGDGQLGDGSLSGRRTPVRVSDP